MRSLALWVLSVAAGIVVVGIAATVFYLLSITDAKAVMVLLGAGIVAILSLGVVCAVAKDVHSWLTRKTAKKGGGK